MRYKQKKLLKSIFLGLTFLIVLVIGFGYLKVYLDGISDDISEPSDEYTSLISVFVNGTKVQEDDRILFEEIGDTHNVSVKFTKTNQFYNERLNYLPQVNDIVSIEDTFGDDKFVSVEITSLGIYENDFYLQIENEDGSFIFTLMIRTLRINVEDINVPDIIFYE